MAGQWVPLPEELVSYLRLQHAVARGTQSTQRGSPLRKLQSAPAGGFLARVSGLPTGSFPANPTSNPEGCFPSVLQHPRQLPVSLSSAAVSSLQ